MKSSFMYAHELSWNWHKGWNLPEIFIWALNTLKTWLASYGHLKCEITSIKYLEDKNQKKIPIEVGMIWATIKDIVNEKANISGIRFATTSHDNKKAKFHLDIIIYGVSGNTSDFGKYKWFQDQSDSFLHLLPIWSMLANLEDVPVPEKTRSFI